MDTGSYMQNQMDDQITAGLHAMDQFLNSLYKDMQEFIDKQGYTFSPTEILTEYKDYYSNGCYVSYTCKKVILEFEERLKIIAPTLPTPEDAGIKDREGEDQHTEDVEKMAQAGTVGVREGAFTYPQMHALIAPLQLDGAFSGHYHWGAGMMKDLIFKTLRDATPTSKEQQGEEDWISVEDAPLFTLDKNGNWECTKVGDGEFWAAVPYIDSKRPERNDLVWVRHCVVEDGVGLCVVGDAENETASWELGQVKYYIPIKLPPLPAPPSNHSELPNQLK